ncbi:MAG: hypothetical protein M3Y56_08550, partial [Armatimonadota bacterium]|nr:hypothetical protein [Armatimonadota bacterium]
MKKFCLFVWLFMWGLCCVTGGHAEPTALRVAADNAIVAGDTKAATKFALAALKENDTPERRSSWQYGNNIHEANQILGLAALREGRVADAKRYLIAAGKTPGSPQLNSFGPHMVLAQELLSRG